MINWAIIGGGDVVRRKSGPAFTIPGASRVAGLWRRTLADAEATAAAIGAEAAFDDVNALLRIDGLDAVYVATPPGARIDFARRIAAAGLPAYFEKPIARNAAEAAEIVSAFDAAGKPLFVAHYRRAWPKFARLKALFQSDAVGPPRNVRYRLERPTENARLDGWLADPAMSGGGKIFDLAPHMLDLMAFLFGDLSLTFAESRGGAVSDLEEQAAFAFETASGAVGAATFDIAGDAAADSLWIRCAAGSIETALYDHGPIRIETADGRRAIDIPSPGFAQGPMIAAVTAYLDGSESGPPPASLATGADALRTARLVDAVLDGFYGGRDRPFWRDYA